MKYLTKMKGPEFGRGSPEVLVPAVDVHGVLKDGGSVRTATFGGHHTLRTRILSPGVGLKLQQEVQQNY